MPGKSDMLEAAVLNSTLRGVAFPSVAGSVYVSLHTADPTDAGTGTEVTGGAYARVAVARAAGSWAVPADNAGAQQTSNSGVITFPNPTASWGTVTHFGIFDAATGGNLLYSGVLGTARAIAPEDNAPSFSAGSLTISEQ